jgi:hypothetical protein
MSSLMENELSAALLGQGLHLKWFKEKTAKPGVFAKEAVTFIEAVAGPNKSPTNFDGDLIAYVLKDKYDRKTMLETFNKGHY